MNDEQILRVAGKTSTQDLAAAISHALYDGKKIGLRAVGAAAVNQAVKATAIASGYVAARGLSLACRPGFDTVTFAEGGERTAMVLRVFTI
jgi:stage V sporulation protein S